MDQAPVDLLSTATPSRGGTGVSTYFSDGFGNSALNEDDVSRDPSTAPLSCLCQCRRSGPSWSKLAVGGLFVCTCVLRRCVRVCVAARWQCCDFESALDGVQLQGLVAEALSLVRGNLSVEILGEQACVFLGSVDGEGKPDGQGVATNKSSQREERNEYRGDFQLGSRHGIGGVKFGDGTTYQGEWVLDHPKGYGVEMYPDGGVFKGRFWNDARHGLGAYYFANGQRYFGRWNTGVRHGEGVEMGKTGDKFFSVFEMGKRVSKVDLRDKRAECMELLTQVDAASQIGEQRAQMAREHSSKLDILSRILNTTSGRDTTVDKLTEIIADMKIYTQQGRPHPEQGGLHSGMANEWSVMRHEEGGRDRVQEIENELGDVTKAVADMKQWSREAKEIFRDEYNSQMLTLRSRCASLQAELSTLTGDAPVSDSFDYGTQSVATSRLKAASGHSEMAVNLQQSMDLAKTSIKAQIDTVSVSELGTDGESLANRRTRKVQFHENARTPLQHTATASNEVPTGTVPVEWIEQAIGGRLVANRFLEKGVLNDTGIMVGDLLAEVDGQPVKDLLYEFVMPLINGPIGSRVRLTVLRSDEPIRLMVERKSIAVLRPNSASESRATTPGSEKSERSDTPMADTGLDISKKMEEKAPLSASSVVGKQNKGFVMMSPAAGGIRWTMHQSPRRLAEQEKKANELEEQRMVAAARKQREAEEATYREEQEMQRRALEEARHRAGAELRKKSEAEAEAKRKAEEKRKDRENAAAMATLEEEEAARKGAEEEEARRVEDANRKLEEEAARKLAEDERMQAELIAIERARAERIERDRIRLEEDKKKADAALTAGLKAARGLDVSTAKKMLEEAIQITKMGHIADRRQEIQQLRVDTEFAQIKVVEMQVEEKIARVRVVLQRETSPMDGRVFCKHDIAEARDAIATARSTCAGLYDSAFYVEHLESLITEVDLAESRMTIATIVDTLDCPSPARQKTQPEAIPPFAVEAAPALSPVVVEATTLEAAPAPAPIPASADAPPSSGDADAAVREVADEYPERVVSVDGAKTPVPATPSPEPSGDLDETAVAASESADLLISGVVTEFLTTAANASDVAFESGDSQDHTPEKKAAQGSHSEQEEEASRNGAGGQSAPLLSQSVPSFKFKQPPLLPVDQIKAERNADDAQFQPPSVPEVAHESEDPAGPPTFKSEQPSALPVDKIKADPKVEDIELEAALVPGVVHVDDGQPQIDETAPPKFNSKKPAALPVNDVKADPKVENAELEAAAVPTVHTDEEHAVASASESAAPAPEAVSTDILASVAAEPTPQENLSQNTVSAHSDAAAEPAPMSLAVDEKEEDTNTSLEDDKSAALAVDATSALDEASDATGTSPLVDATAVLGEKQVVTELVVEQQDAAVATAKLRQQVAEEERERLQAEAEQEIAAATEALRVQMAQQQEEKLVLLAQMVRDKQELEEKNAHLVTLNAKLQQDVEEAAATAKTATEHAGAGAQETSAVQEERVMVSERVVKLAQEKEELLQQMVLEVGWVFCVYQCI